MPGHFGIRITSANHGLTTGQTVTITGALGNTQANGTYTVTVIDPNNFTLNIPNGGGYAPGGPAAYNTGGVWTVVSGELLKLGTLRLVSQSAGTYTGGVDIQGGVLDIQNQTALGLGSSGAITFATNASPIVITSDQSNLASIDTSWSVLHTALVQRRTVRARYHD